MISIFPYICCYAGGIKRILCHFIRIVIQLLCGVLILFSSHYDFFFAHVYTFRSYILISACWNVSWETTHEYFTFVIKSSKNFVKIYKHIDGNFYCRKHKYLWFDISKCHPPIFSYWMIRMYVQKPSIRT